MLEVALIRSDKAHPVYQTLLKEQFNQLCVFEPQRFPAYFYAKGSKYKIKIEKG